MCVCVWVGGGGGGGGGGAESYMQVHAVIFYLCAFNIFPSQKPSMSFGHAFIQAISPPSLGVASLFGEAGHAQTNPPPPPPPHTHLSFSTHNTHM